MPKGEGGKKVPAPGVEGAKVKVLVAQLCDSATPWTEAHQAPLSLGFPGKNTGVGCYAFLQGIFLTQGSNLHLRRCRQVLDCLSHQASKREVCLMITDNF